MMLYNIPAFATSKDFMIAVARSRGRLKKGGVPDVSGTAKSILRDWNAGRIPYYTVPPSAPVYPTTSANEVNSASQKVSVMKNTDDVGSAAIVTELAPEFDLDGLFKEADGAALEGLKSTKEMGPGGVVRMNESMVGIEDDNGAADGTFSYKLMGEPDEALDGEDDDGDINMGAIIGKKSKKRKSDVHESTVVSTAPNTKQKRVSFQANGETGLAAPSQKAKMFADAPEEAPIQLNKDIKNQVKKDKKNKRKAVKKDEKEEAELSNALSSVGLKHPAEKEQEADSGMDNLNAAPYDFAKFFGGP